MSLHFTLFNRNNRFPVKLYQRGWVWYKTLPLESNPHMVYSFNIFLWQSPPFTLEISFNSIVQCFWKPRCCFFLLKLHVIIKCSNITTLFDIVSFDCPFSYLIGISTILIQITSFFEKVKYQYKNNHDSIVLHLSIFIYPFRSLSSLVPSFFFEGWGGWVLKQ